MKIKFLMITILGGLTLMTISCASVFGLITVEQAEYETLLVDGDFEMRQYNDMLIATTHVASEYDDSSSVGFRRIAGYIFGDNKSKNKTSGSEEIAMTAPVLQRKDDSGWHMSFVMPKEKTMDSLPIPNESNVSIQSVQPKKMAVVRYSGTLSEEKIHQNSDKLLEWIQQKGFKVISGPVSAGYNPPWTLPFLRRNEIMIEVE